MCVTRPCRWPAKALGQDDYWFGNTFRRDIHHLKDMLPHHPSYHLVNAHVHVIFYSAGKAFLISIFASMIIACCNQIVCFVFLAGFLASSFKTTTRAPPRRAGTTPRPRWRLLVRLLCLKCLWLSLGYSTDFFGIRLVTLHVATYVFKSPRPGAVLFLATVAGACCCVYLKIDFTIQQLTEAWKFMVWRQVWLCW